jgi:exosome complex component MTR3
LDPTEEELRLSNGAFVLACMPALKAVTSIWQCGQMKGQEVLDVRQSSCGTECGY